MKRNREEVLALLKKVMTDERPIRIDFSGGQLFDLIVVLEEASKAQDLPETIRDSARVLKRHFQNALATLHPDIHDFLDGGWLPGEDE
jgi:hypothetical protein